MSYLGNALINLVLRNTPFQSPATLYLALMTDAGEVVGSGYSRVNVTGVFAPPSSEDTTFNLTRIDFPVPVAPWGTIISAAVFDAPTGGNMLFGGLLATTVNVPAQTPVYYDAGILQFAITVTGGV